MTEQFDLLRAARPEDLFIRWRVDPQRVSSVMVDGDHVAWVRDAPEDAWVTVLGTDPHRVTALLRDGIDARATLGRQIHGLTVEAPVFVDLPEGFLPPEHGYWSHWLLLEPDLELQNSATSRARVIASDDPRIDPLLTHSTSAHVFTAHPVTRWAGIEQGEDLIAVAAIEGTAAGAQHLVSVCTHPDHRGRGLARDVCALLTRLALEEGAPIVELEMYADNEAARRTYTSLGFTELGRYRSGRLAAPLP